MALNTDFTYEKYSVIIKENQIIIASTLDYHEYTYSNIDNDKNCLAIIKYISDTMNLPAIHSDPTNNSIKEYMIKHYICKYIETNEIKDEQEMKLIYQDILTKYIMKYICNKDIEVQNGIITNINTLNSRVSEIDAKYKPEKSKRMDSLFKI